jgi:hypothetical protein
METYHHWRDLSGPRSLLSCSEAKGKRKSTRRTRGVEGLLTVIEALRIGIVVTSRMIGVTSS